MLVDGIGTLAEVMIMIFHCSSYLLSTYYTQGTRLNASQDFFYSHKNPEREVSRPGLNVCSS